MRTASLIAALALLALPRPAVAAEERPNILFVYADDHASHAISAYGSRINRTPNLDRIAAEGMRFDRCFVGNSICAPARATILTGMHSHRNGVLDNGVVFDGTQRTFPKLLRAAGYQTAIVGKWHLKSDPTGFDHWEVLIGQGPYYNPPIQSAEGTRTIEGYTTDVITDLALGWLREERDPERPFLLMYQHKAPHREWEPGPQHLALYDDVEIPEPPTLFDDYAGRCEPARLQEMTIARHMNERDLKLAPPPRLNEEQRASWDAAYDPKNAAFAAAGLEGEDLVRWKYQRYLKDYLRCIASVDDNLGRVLDYLDEAGLTQNTVVVYSSDQGFYLGDHGWYDKRWMYEESFSTPLLVRWPGVVAPGAVDRHLAQNIDLAPTFLELAGLPVPAEMQGRSLAPILRGEEPEAWRRSLYYHYYEFPGVHAVRRHCGVRTERFKLIHFYQQGCWELFDLEEDPLELTSVYDDPAYERVRAELSAELRRLQEHYGDTEPDRPLSAIKMEFARRRATEIELVEVFRLDGPAVSIPAAGDPAFKPLTVGCRCAPAAPDGVLVAHGGGTHGYSLYLKDGVPRFAVRSDGELFEAAAPGPLRTDRPAHVVGTLDADGTLRLYVDGRLTAEASGALVTAPPAEGAAAGSDPGSPVGDYEGPAPFQGSLEDVRLYWGVLPLAELVEWVGS